MEKVNLQLKTEEYLLFSVMLNFITSEARESSASCQLHCSELKKNIDTRNYIYFSGIFFLKRKKKYRPMRWLVCMCACIFISESELGEGGRF